MKLKWILRDSNIYISLLLVYMGVLSLGTHISVTFFAFGFVHFIKTCKFITDRVFYISNFNNFITVACYLIFIMDYFTKTNFSAYLIFAVSAKELLFTRYTTSLLKYYTSKIDIVPDFTVVVQNDLKEYIFKESLMPVSYIFYVSNVEFIISDDIKGIKTEEHFIPLDFVKKYCMDAGIQYSELSHDHVENMKMISY